MTDSEEHRKWRTGVDRALGSIEANVKTILINQRTMTSACVTKHGDLAKRVVKIEAEEYGEKEIKKWKERFFGFLLSLAGLVIGIFAKVFWDQK